MLQCGRIVVPLRHVHFDVFNRRGLTRHAYTTARTPHFFFSFVLIVFVVHSSHPYVMGKLYKLALRTNYSEVGTPIIPRKSERVHWSGMMSSQPASHGPEDLTQEDPDGISKIQIYSKVSITVWIEEL